MKKRVISVVIIIFVMSTMFFFAEGNDQMNCCVTIQVKGKTISAYNNLDVKLYKDNRQQRVNVILNKKYVYINWEPDLDKYFLKLHIPLKDKIDNISDMNAVMEYFHFPDGTSTNVKWNINYIQKKGRWIAKHTVKIKMGNKKEITDTYEFSSDKKQFLYYGV